jgi:hypothetical protein
LGYKQQDTEGRDGGGQGAPGHGGGGEGAERSDDDRRAGTAVE